MVVQASRIGRTVVAALANKNAGHGAFPPAPVLGAYLTGCGTAVSVMRSSRKLERKATRVRFSGTFGEGRQ